MKKKSIKINAILNVISVDFNLESQNMKAAFERKMPKKSSFER